MIALLARYHRKRPPREDDPDLSRWAIGHADAFIY
jgi:hypothetical protein